MPHNGPVWSVLSSGQTKFTLSVIIYRRHIIPNANISRRTWLTPKMEQKEFEIVPEMPSDDELVSLRQDSVETVWGFFVGLHEKIPMKTQGFLKCSFNKKNYKIDMDYLFAKEILV